MINGWMDAWIHACMHGMYEQTRERNNEMKKYSLIISMSASTTLVRYEFNLSFSSPYRFKRCHAYAK